MGIQRLEHVGIFVTDVARSVAFYTDVLGLEVKREVQYDSEQLVFLGIPSEEHAFIELISAGNTGLAEVGFVHHAAFTVSDLAAEMIRMKRLGVEFMSEQPGTLQSGGRFIFFYGPDREHLELFELPKRG